MHLTGVGRSSKLAEEDELLGPVKSTCTGPEVHQPHEGVLKRGASGSDHIARGQSRLNAKTLFRYEDERTLIQVSFRSASDQDRYSTFTSSLKTHVCKELR